MNITGSGRQREQKDAEYIMDHYGELKAQYLEWWIAVFNHEVVANAVDAFDLIPQLRGKGLQGRGAIRIQQTTGPDVCLGMVWINHDTGGSIKWPVRPGEEYRLEDDPHYQDVLFLKAHRDEFLKRYPDKWIAIWDKEVVAVADSESGLPPQLKAKGLQSVGVLVREMETDPKLWILPVQ